jgi:hypothetical protein
VINCKNLGLIWQYIKLVSTALDVDRLSAAQFSLLSPSFERLVNAGYQAVVKIRRGRISSDTGRYAVNVLNKSTEFID